MVLIIVFISFFIATFVEASLEARRTPLKNMTILHEWNNLEYFIKNSEDYIRAIESGVYKLEGFKRPYDIDMGLDKNNNPFLVMSTPLVLPSIPFTIAKVSNVEGMYGPYLIPFGGYELYSKGDKPDCEKIVSVFRIFVDACNNLWAIDTGRNFSATNSFVCPPKILKFSMKTEKLVYKYVIPKEQYNDLTVYNGIIVNIIDRPPMGKCRRGNVYLTDARGASYNVLKFNSTSSESWMIKSDKFLPEPEYINTTINGLTFAFMDGLYTSSIDYKRDLIYMHKHASVSEMAIKLSIVNDKRNWENNPYGNPDDFKIIGKRDTQCPVQALDSKLNNLYFSQYVPVSIQSWDPDTEYRKENFKVLVVNNDYLGFVAGMKIVKGMDHQEYLLTLTNNLQRSNTGTMKLSEKNFIAMACRTSTLQSGKGSCGNPLEKPRMPTRPIGCGSDFQ